MSEELDSQLSAMFDDQLPQAECELLARRLARDEALRQRWGRYAAMRACFREEGSRHSVRIASRVRAQLTLEVAHPATTPKLRVGDSRARRWWGPIAGLALASGVAAVSIFWVRAEAPGSVVASSGAPSAAVTAAAPRSAEPDSYVVPVATDTPVFAPTTELANYVVAHSEYSTPLNRRSLLSSFVSAESAPAMSPAESAAPADAGERDQANVAR